MFGLSDEDIEKINDVFSSFYEVDRVVLYGSRAKGNYRKGSDIDFTIAVLDHIKRVGVVFFQRSGAKTLS